MKNIFIYTFLRILILASFLGVGYLAGLRGVLLLVMGFLASGIVSLFVLSKTRDQLSSSIFSGFQRVNKRIAAAAEKEDKIIDGN
ncbi:MAG: DUF4229 domain-containing protein [Actinobacteria bacterium]|jgi:hypothetical protein|nr:DUF4229 domain-containing protein [Actinomycetota bacterium]